MSSVCVCVCACTCICVFTYVPSTRFSWNKSSHHHSASIASCIVSEGSIVTFTCTASGSPTSISWQKDSVTLVPSATVTINTSGGTSMLLLDFISSTDAGSYTCTATNAGGSTTSNSATLTIGSEYSLFHISFVNCCSLVNHACTVLVI